MWFGSLLVFFNLEVFEALLFPKKNFTRYDSEGNKQTQSIKSPNITKEKFKVLKIQNLHEGQYLEGWQERALDVTVEMTQLSGIDDDCVLPRKFIKLVEAAWLTSTTSVLKDYLASEYCNKCPRGQGWHTSLTNSEGKVTCFKYFGKSKAADAASICKDHGAKLPLPKNWLENNRLYSTYKSKVHGSAVGSADSRNEF